SIDFVVTQFADESMFELVDIRLISLKVDLAKSGYGIVLIQARDNCSTFGLSIVLWVSRLVSSPSGYANQLLTRRI
ncbi:hypothetical protein U1Q18_008363, partial [Sarracenia purpurea var. burkii]